MQQSHPEGMTPEESALIGKLRREYFTDETKMRHRREQLRVQGEKVEPAVPMTTEEMLTRGNVILISLTTIKDGRVRAALRAELTSLAYALSDAPRE